MAAPAVAVGAWMTFWLFAAAITFAFAICMLLIAVFGRHQCSQCRFRGRAVDVLIHETEDHPQ